MFGQALADTQVSYGLRASKSNHSGWCVVAETQQTCEPCLEEITLGTTVLELDCDNFFFCLLSSCFSSILFFASFFSLVEVL